MQLFVKHIYTAHLNTFALHTDLITTEREAIVSLTSIQNNKEIIFVTPFLFTL